MGVQWPSCLKYGAKWATFSVFVKSTTQKNGKGCNRAKAKLHLVNSKWWVQVLKYI